MQYSTNSVTEIVQSCCRVMIQISLILPSPFSRFYVNDNTTITNDKNDSGEF